METLIGVGVGWLLAVSRDLASWLWKRREAGDAERSDRRLAARLVFEELLAAKRMLLGALERKLLWDSQHLLPGHVWQEYEKTLGRASGEGDRWATISTAYAELDELNWKASLLHAEGYGEPELDTFLGEVKAVLRVVDQAEEALRRLGR